MAPLILEGRTLGEKHENFNKLVQETIASKKTVEPADLNSGEDDLNNLLKIDIASNNRDVEYILEVLKSEDMLYVSRAIKRCTWLITDQQYAHIVNPEYLNLNLFPKMTPKATIKLMKHIKLNLKDETRCQEFYKNENDVQGAVKWLPNCSTAFVENAVKEHSKFINTRLLKRLCEKSITILEIDMEVNPSLTKSRLETTKFLLNSDTDKYLDLIEKHIIIPYHFPRFGAKLTEMVMKKCPNRIINNFEFYVKFIHLPTFVKYMKKEDVKDFLYEKSSLEQCSSSYLFKDYENIKLFIEVIPEKERFQFVKDVFIDKIHTEETNENDGETFRMRRLYCTVAPYVRAYQFYEFAPFDIAFAEITKLIRNDISSNKTIPMLEVLVKCAGRNLQQIHTLLQYYHDKHINDNFEKKYAFVNTLISETSTHKYDENTWNLLNEVFESMEVYNNSHYYVQECVESIIVYKVVHDDAIPKIIEEKFEFNTLTTYQKKLNQKEKEKTYNYLYNYMLTRLQKQSYENENDFNEAVELLILLMDILIDWKKELLDYPVVLSKIKEFIKVKKENSWKTSLKHLYNKNKTWKKYMFDESLELCPSEEVCINSLKHGPELLTSYKSEVEELQCNDAVSLRRLLSKLRIYWPQSLANEWTSSYLGRMDQEKGIKSLIRGLCLLLPRQQLLELIQKYAPIKAKIDFDEINELELSLQRHIAKNMHLARPQPPPDAILFYAKGDYLQYALPSLLAIFYNMNAITTREHIFKLLEAPVSIQKHGIRFAFCKLQSDELKQLFLNIWKQTNNATIRSIIFQFTFRLLCKETNSSRAKVIWNLLETFIDALSYEEDKSMYLLLTTENIKKAPLVIKADYLMKSYNFLKRLQPNLKGEDREKYQNYTYSLAEYTREIMELLPCDFVEDILVEFVSENWVKPTTISDQNRHLEKVMSAYILCANDEETQTKRTNEFFIPYLDQSLFAWDWENNEKNYYIRTRIQEFLDRLSYDLRDYVVEKKFLVPVKLFSVIQSKIDTLPVSENYIMLTKWKLTVELASIISKYESNDDWIVRCAKASEEFGKKCLLYLKEDVLLYFPNIFVLFSKALLTVINLVPEIIRWDIYKRLVTDKDFIQGYLATITLFPQNVPKERKDTAEELRKVILEHPSVEVKIYYYHKMGI